MATVLLGAIALSGTTVYADDVDVDVDAVITSTLSETMTTPLDFGTIEIDQAGDIISITGVAGIETTVTAAGGSVVGAGTTGLITLTSPSSFDISAAYPASTNVTDGTTTATLTGVDTLSLAGTAQGPLTHVGGTPSLIYIGGDLNVPAGASAGTYTGTLTVTLTYL